jgi:hypothetical protein
VSRKRSNQLSYGPTLCAGPAANAAEDVLHYNGFCLLHRDGQKIHLFSSLTSAKKTLPARYHVSWAARLGGEHHHLGSCMKRIRLFLVIILPGFESAQGEN